METIDFKKSLKSLYAATSKIKEVEPGTGKFLVVSGKGSPGGEAFQNAMGQLYGVAYTLRFSLKFAGVIDFKVCCLEGLYSEDPNQVPLDEWPFRFMIRVPEAIKADQVEATRHVLKVKKGVDASGVLLEEFSEGRALQVLHVGPYNQVGQAYSDLVARAGELGLVMNGAGHEIYISDPNRVAPERLKTIVRIPVTEA